MSKAYLVSSYALGPRSDQVTRFKSTKEERVKINKGLTNGKNSPWVGKTHRSDQKRRNMSARSILKPDFFWGISLQPSLNFSYSLSIMDEPYFQLTNNAMSTGMFGCMIQGCLKLFEVDFCYSWVCVRIVCVEYGASFFESKREWGGRGVKEKNHNQVLNNEAAKDVADGMDFGFVDPKVVEGVDEPASILDVHSRYGFSLYGYYVGKRVAFRVVENYVKNAWKKFGLVRAMMNSKGFLFFKFASIEGMNGVFENGPRADRELKEDMVIAIPNVEYDGEIFHTMRVEYE
uniref:DUF4283 domain-containing protein n=1 Tax=Tanacetum cinerariifolium TaxID=118510 RepID=A0A6L2NQK5_TANCI|nr:hypothetical protein [Tanacetum cinerariifolium]